MMSKEKDSGHLTFPRGVNVAIGSFVFTIAFLGSIANILILVILSRTHKLRKRYCFVLNFTGCHIFAACSYIGIAYKSSTNQRLIESTFTCLLDGLMLGIVANAAIYILVLIAIEHYLVTQYPFFIQQLTLRKKLGLVAIAYILSVMANIPPVMGWGSRIKPVGYGWFCSFDMYDRSFNNRSFFIFLYVVSFFAPFGFMVILYIIIWRNSFCETGQRVRHHRRMHATFQLVQSAAQKEEELIQNPARRPTRDSAIPMGNSNINDNNNNFDDPAAGVKRSTSSPGVGFKEELKKTLSSGSGNKPTSRRQTNRSDNASNREMKFLKTSISLVTSFCFAWLPFAITSLIVQFTDLKLHPITMEFSAIFAKSFILWNPLMHAINDSRFRNEFTRVSAVLFNYNNNITISGGSQGPHYQHYYNNNTRSNTNNNNKKNSYQYQQQLQQQQLQLQQQQDQHHHRRPGSSSQRSSGGRSTVVTETDELLQTQNSPTRPLMSMRRCQTGAVEGFHSSCYSTAPDDRHETHILRDEEVEEEKGEEDVEARRKRTFQSVAQITSPPINSCQNETEKQDIKITRHDNDEKKPKTGNLFKSAISTSAPPADSTASIQPPEQQPTRNINATNCPNEILAQNSKPYRPNNINKNSVKTANNSPTVLENNENDTTNHQPVLVHDSRREADDWCDSTVTSGYHYDTSSKSLDFGDEERPVVSYLSLAQLQKPKTGKNPGSDDPKHQNRHEREDQEGENDGFLLLSNEKATNTNNYDAQLIHLKPSFSSAAAATLFNDQIIYRSTPSSSNRRSSSIQMPNWNSVKHSELVETIV